MLGIVLSITETVSLLSRCITFLSLLLHCILLETVHCSPQTCIFSVHGNEI
jgi:hypothetical protein